MGRTLLTRAIVLRRRVYGEADLVVTLLGQDTGHVAALARSARRSTRRFAGGLGMAMAGEAALKERQGGDLLILESFDVYADRSGLGGDLAKTAHAAYALELCDRLCPARHPDPPIFAWLDQFLTRLTAGTATAERLRIFELGLLRGLGMGPSFDRCVACGRADLADENVRFLPSAGGIYCCSCARTGDIVPGPVRQALAQLGKAGLDDGSQGGGLSLEGEMAAQCRRIVLALVREQVRGPLRSLDFIEKMTGVMSGSR